MVEENYPISKKLDNPPNPTYGAMGKKVTPFGSYSIEGQARCAMIPYRTINVEKDLTKSLRNEPIRIVPVDLTPIRKMDDLK